MEISSFLIEDWMNDHEDFATYNLAETCVYSMSMDQLFDLTGTDREVFLREMTSRRLTYGTIDGSHGFRKGISSMYQTITPDDIRTTHGAAGANHLVFYSLVSPGDMVVCVGPTYQQLYSIPESFGAKVTRIPLKKEDQYYLDTTALRRMSRAGADLICINNPNNPTGARIPDEQLLEIADFARQTNAVVLCDEVYRNLTQDGSAMMSIADVYERGISTGSMSKVFSFAGLRLGWVACRDKKIMEKISSHRDYSHISCGMIDEMVSDLVLSNYDQVLNRSRTMVRENLAILEEFVESTPILSWVKPQAGTTALLHYKHKLVSYKLCERLLEETGVLLSPGVCFGLENCVRIGYACDGQELRDGLRLFGEFLNRLTAGRR